MEYVKKCDKCQRFVEGDKAPPKHLHAVTSPWPFHKWRIDILGPFPLAPGQIKFFIVVVDYFTKWVEAEPVATISSERIKHFFWKKIVYRFGILVEIAQFEANRNNYKPDNGRSTMPVRGRDNYKSNNGRPIEPVRGRDNYKLNNGWPKLANPGAPLSPITDSRLGQSGGATTISSITDSQN
ncbi:hypothetical protein CR513_42975, partial [Mucuna pruriens]